MEELIRAQAEFFQATTLRTLYKLKFLKNDPNELFQSLKPLIPKLPPPAQGHTKQNVILELHFSTTRKRIQHIISSPFNKYFCINMHHKAFLNWNIFMFQPSINHLAQRTQETNRASEHSARFHFIFVEKVDLAGLEMFQSVPGQVWCLCVHS